MRAYRASVDIGGTFTDFIVAQPERRTVAAGKVPTTAIDPARGVLQGLEALVADLTEIDFLVHGTTVGLNAFLERKGARTLLIMTAGLRDAYTIARGDRKELYALRYRKPERLVPRRDVHEVRERIDHAGRELEPLRGRDFDPIVRKIEREGIESVAVCFIHSYAYPEHELQAREHLSQVLPDLSITLSHEIAREWREYERASTAVTNAYIAPAVERYLDSLLGGLEGLDVKAPLHVMQSSGGVMTAPSARSRPVYTLLSGPVGGTIGGAALSEAMQHPHLLCVDMGGTSFDLSLIVDGTPRVTSEVEFEGLPLLMSAVDIRTIGAGGGSLAWLEGGRLRMGPRSAGSTPGPACYGAGGTEATVTDANLFLNRLGTRSLLGGRMELDRQAAGEALARLSRPLGMESTALAEGILSIINAKMADAIRTITVRQGIDPRRFSLVAFGGAGPMHAVWLARELEISEVIVPRTPGAFSAWGMLQTDVRHDLTRTLYQPLETVSIRCLKGIYEELESEGKQLLRLEGLVHARMYFQRSADMRYIGQEYSVSVPVGNRFSRAGIGREFHRIHDLRYGHSTPGAPAEIVNLRVAALGSLHRLDPRSLHFEAPAVENQGRERLRQCIFSGRKEKTPVLSRSELGPEEMSGPLILEEETATTVIPPGCRARVDEWGSIRIRI